MGFNLAQSGFARWIRSRSREEWLGHWREQVTDVRIWIQEHAEKALLVGIVVGVALVLLFRLIFWVLVIVVVAAVIVWFFALPESRMPHREPSPDTGPDPKTGGSGDL